MDKCWNFSSVEYFPTGFASFLRDGGDLADNVMTKNIYVFPLGGVQMVLEEYLYSPLRARIQKFISCTCPKVTVYGKG